MIRLYCGINEKRWNHHPVQPGPYACVAPVYGRSARTHAENRVFVPDGVEVIQDSGAFSDNVISRLSYAAALDRQIAHAEKYGYSGQITHRASYDVLIDEVWTDGNRSKRRWSELDAESAVDETVKAAAFLHQHRSGLSLIQSAQGVTPAQYLRCTLRLLPYIEAGDIFGLGGWCITGKLKAVMTPVFRETMRLVIPAVAARGITRAHIWGVIFPTALGELLHICDEYGVSLSTDSAGPSVKPCFGDWGYGEWRDKSYSRPLPEQRGLERARHVQATREWLENFRSTPHYRPVHIPPMQLPLFEVAA